MSWGMPAILSQSNVLTKQTANYLVNGKLKLHNNMDTDGCCCCSAIRSAAHARPSLICCQTQQPRMDLDDSQKWSIFPSDTWQFTDPWQNDMPAITFTYIITPLLIPVSKHKPVLARVPSSFNQKSLRAPKLGADSSLKFPCCRLVTNEQYVTSSRLINHVIAANQPLHWLHLFHDIKSEKSSILFVQPAMLNNRTILSLDQRIAHRCCAVWAKHIMSSALAAEPVRLNANGTYDIEANTKSHRGLRWIQTFAYGRSTIPQLLCCINFRFTTITYIMTMRVFIRNIAGGDSSM